MEFAYGILYDSTVRFKIFGSIFSIQPLGFHYQIFFLRSDSFELIEGNICSYEYIMSTFFIICFQSVVLL